MGKLVLVVVGVLVLAGSAQAGNDWHTIHLQATGGVQRWTSHLEMSPDNAVAIEVRRNGRAFKDWQEHGDDFGATLRIPHLLLTVRAARTQGPLRLWYAGKGSFTFAFRPLN